MFRAEVWLITSLFCFGVIAGMVLSWPESKPELDNTATATKLANVNKTVEILPSNEQLSRLQKVIDDNDRILLAGGFRDAALGYRRLLERVPTINRPEVLLRLGIALEQAGFAGQAETAFSEATRFQQNKVYNLLAQTGLARVWETQGSHQDSLTALSNLYLRDATFESVDEVDGEVKLLLAKNFINLGTSIRQIDDGSLQNTWMVDLPFDLESTMLLLTQNDNVFAQVKLDVPANPTEMLPDANQASPLAPGVAIIQRPLADPDVIALDVSLDVTSLTMLLQQLAAASDMPFEITPEAAGVLRGRSKALQLRGKSLANVLDSILLPLGLTWNWDGGRVTVLALSSLDKDAVAMAYFRAANRVLDHFALTRSGDYRAAFARGFQGNVYMLMNEPDQAVALFESMLQTESQGELAARICTNLAIIQRGLSRPEIAIALLFRAVDLSLDLDLQANAYRLIAEISIEEGDFAAAISAGSRGARIGGNNRVKERSAIALAQAYLLSNEPVSANQALFDSRSAFETTQSLHLASLIGAYSRFIVTESEINKRNETERLLIELARSKFDGNASVVDDYIAAKAFQTMGLEQDCIELIQQALSKTTKNYWRRRLAFELAVLEHEYGDSQAAIEVLAIVEDQYVDSLATLAVLERAKIHLDEDDAQLCLDSCRKLMDRKLNDDEKKVALNIMGQAYRKLDRHYAAALCYAGILPFEQCP